MEGASITTNHTRAVTNIPAIAKIKWISCASPLFGLSFSWLWCLPVSMLFHVDEKLGEAEETLVD